MPKIGRAYFVILVKQHVSIREFIAALDVLYQIFNDFCIVMVMVSTTCKFHVFREVSHSLEAFSTLVSPPSISILMKS